MNINRMAEHNYSEMIMGDQDTDLLSFEFNAPQQHHVLKVDDISKPYVMFQKNPSLAVTKEQSIGSKLFSIGFTSNLGLLQNTPSNIEVIQSQPTVSSYQMLPEPVFENELNQENGQAAEIQVYEENLIIDQEVQTEGGMPIIPEILMKDHEVHAAVGQGSETNVQHHGMVQSYERDEEVDALTQYLNSGENQPDFVAVASEKKRNPPYLIKDSTKITTKNDEPVKFCHTGAKVGNLVWVSMRFREEKYRSFPVIACPIHRKDADTSNFVLTAENANLKYEDILEHPTAHLRLDANNIDIWGNFNFFISFRCLNSCHKGNGKKMELVFKLKDQEKVLQERRFEIRACKNVKRDYKEAFQDEEMSVADKLVPPESLIHQDKVQQDRPMSVCQEEVKPVKKKKNEVKVHMIKKCEENPEARENNMLIKCVPAKKPEVLKPKYYCIHLPTIEKEKNVLETVRLYGGSVFDLESVFPVEVPEEEEREDP